MHEYSQFASFGIDVKKVRAPDSRAARFKYGSPTSKTCLNIFANTRFSWSRAASSARIWVSHHVPTLRANAVQQHSFSEALLSACNVEKISGRVLGSWMEMSFAAKATAGLNVEVDD